MQQYLIDSEVFVLVSLSYFKRHLPETTPYYLSMHDRLIRVSEFVEATGSTPGQEYCYKPLSHPENEKFKHKPECLNLLDRKTIEKYGQQACWVPITTISNQKQYV